jgi:hypothetical protein
MANLTARDVQKMYELHDPATATVLSAMIMGGANVQVRETAVDRRVRKAEEAKRFTIDRQRNP